MYIFSKLLSSSAALRNRKVERQKPHPSFSPSQAPPVVLSHSPCLSFFRTSLRARHISLWANKKINSFVAGCRAPNDKLQLRFSRQHAHERARTLCGTATRRLFFTHRARASHPALFGSGDPRRRAIIQADERQRVRESKRDRGRKEGERDKERERDRGSFVAEDIGQMGLFRGQAGLSRSVVERSPH